VYTSVHERRCIPHAASEFTLERDEQGWKIVGDTPWVLISDRGADA